MINLERRVVCAANRYKEHIILGVRHWDTIMVKRAKEILGADIHGAEWEQGFINTWGEFLTREEALKVAIHNNQMIREPYNDTELFSENLY